MRSSTRAGPDPGFFEGVWANQRAGDYADIAAARRQDALDRANAELVAELTRRGIDGSYSRRGLMTGFRTEYDEGAIWSAIDGVRRKDAKAFAALPATAEEYRARLTAPIDAEFAPVLDTAARSGTGASIVGQLFAGMGQPESIATMPLVAGQAKTVAQALLKGAVLNARIEAVQQPARAIEKAARGQDYTTAEGLTDIAIAGAAGGLLDGAAKGIELRAPAMADAVSSAREAAIARVWDRLPQPIRDKWGSAAKVGDDGLADIVEATYGKGRLSEDEAAAVAVIRRDAELRSANPFVGDGAGVAAHQDRMTSAMSAILADVPMPSARAATIADAKGSSSLSPVRRGAQAIDQDIVGFFQSRGYTPGQARGIAAGIAAESRSSHTIINPDSGAYGLGQWLGSRKRELFRRYGQNPTRAQQLDYLDWELRGGDHGGAAVRLAADEASALNAYITRFMRPAKGRETTGDIERGMSALGRAGEALPASAAESGDALAQLDAERVQIDAEAAGLAQAPPQVDPIDAAVAAIATPDAPELQPVLDAPAPLPVLRPEVARAAGVAESYQGRTLPVRNRPTVIEYLADRGGVRDDEGHDLRKGRGWGEVKPFRSGRLVRKAGMSIDDAGELLHEAGFFVERPTTAEVLELVERGVQGEKIYALHDTADAVAAADQRYQSKWGDEELDARRAEVREELNDYADFLDDDMVDAIVMARQGREAPEPVQLLEELVLERYQNLATRANEEVGGEGDGWRDEFDHGEGGIGPDRAAAVEPVGDDGGPAPAPASAGRSDAAGGTGDEAGEPSALTARAFDDPDAQAAREQADSIEHDLRAALTVSFTTAKGSTYRVEANGATVRDKAFRPEHGPSEQGLQPMSQATYYVSAADALALAEFQAEGQGRVAIQPLSDGRIGLRYLDGKDAGKFEKRTVVRPLNDPAVGLTPVEVWNDGTRVHFGNEIVAVRRGEAIDPAIAERQRQQAALKAGSPLQAKADQESTIGLGLFDASDQYRLDTDAGDRSAADVLADLDSEAEAIATVRGCLKPGGTP